MSRRKTNEEYIEECKQQGYDLPIQHYVNARTKIKHKCSKCGYVYEQTPNNHLQGNGCPICSGNKKKTPKKYYNECKEKGLDLPIEEYKGTHTKIKHIYVAKDIFMNKLLIIIYEDKVALIVMI